MEKIKLEKQLKKYPDYKESGIDWIGEIPKFWEVKKIKSDFSFEKGKGSAKFTQDFINNPENSGPYPVYSGQTEGEGIMGKINNYVYDFSNDVIFATTVGAKVMTPMLLSGKFNLSQNCLLMVSKNNNTSSKFFYYQLFPLFKRMKDDIPSHMQPSLRISDLNRYLVISPTVKDQEKIANYLDEKTELIEQIIGKKKMLIELLQEKRMATINRAVTKGLDNGAEMVDSGIDWIGEIPKKWQLKKLKYISNTRVSNVDKKSEDEIMVKLCNYLDVYRNEIIKDQTGFMVATASRGQIENFGLNKGDVIITKDSESPDDIGVPAYVDLNDTKDIVCGYHLAISTPNVDFILGKFLFRLFQSSIFRSYFEVNSNGMTRFGLSTYAIFNSSILLPSISEQSKVIEFLDEKLDIINVAVDKINISIGLLTEYRSSLISSAVTGKILI